MMMVYYYTTILLWYFSPPMLRGLRVGVTLVLVLSLQSILYICMAAVDGVDMQ